MKDCFIHYDCCTALDLKQTCSQFNSGIRIAYLDKNGTGIKKIGIEVCYK